MENNNWKLATFQPPQINEDVLIYSSSMKGFAVGQLQFSYVSSNN